MKTKFILCICLLVTVVVVQAQDYRWELGLNIYPNLYWKYNKLEYNMNGIKAVAPDYPNGVAIGVTVQRQLNNGWGIATGLEYSKQSQKFVSSGGRFFATDTGETFYSFNEFSKLNIAYVSLPIQVTYNLPINQSDGWYLYTKQGINVSYLVNYNSMINSYNGDGSFFSSLKHSYGGIIQYQSDVNQDFYRDGDTAYKYFALGYTGNMGIKKRLSNRTSVQGAIRFDYDFTNADNVSGLYNRTTNGMNYFTDWYNMDNRPASHNMRIGLEVGVSYQLD
ncbi:outer membrane beta-barrel protein [Yeosuana marina]|uniref:outer membrane beta-barrel protein n=1 Tax=Yeosuana marina TaxID=1565536 RepID=UPI0030C7C0E1